MLHQPDSINPGDRAALLPKHGITVAFEFVPFSKSRNAKEKHRSLNWRVTLRKDGRDIVTTDYSAGIGHCPAYNAKGFGDPFSIMRNEAVALECEGGFTAIGLPGGRVSQSRASAIEPDPESVVDSLLSDAGVLDATSYEDWATDAGYDPDSRKGEALYKECLVIALKLRNGLGEAVLAELREAFQDY